MSIAKRGALALATLALIVLPGGSIVVGAVWLYRHLAAGRAAA